MPYINVGKENSKDIEIYYKDWGSGQPVVFSHGWPLSADAFEDQMFYLVSHGYRSIAHDRRGHGRSSQPWSGNDMDTYADDLAKLVESLDLKDAIHVGHSTGGGEVARYIGRHGTKRVAKTELIGAVPPLMLKTAANPGGPCRWKCSARSAPPALRENLLAAIEDVTDEPVTNMIYSHWPADHVGAASVYGTKVKRVGHDKTRELLERFPDPHRPPPTQTFAKDETLDVNGVKVELWMARTSPDIEFSSVTVLTRDEDRAIVHIANPLNSRKAMSP